ncbi:hypothetical protein CNBD3440 [Cryptococcus deneoformans B-3501A]|nr:hypothetical protein CNBD3440 [Cryptococcus neoformans var. neoformans B-3501A]EAL21290.1 hypothetical protein CNBD3440 [Cryptococcus neoformans var. neoformans B-3501A]
MAEGYGKWRRHGFRKSLQRRSKSGGRVGSVSDMPPPMKAPLRNPPRLLAGEGRVHLSASNAHPSFSTRLAAYPLKLLSPIPLPSQPSNFAVLYTLAYGGGLVAGDLVSLSVVLDPGCGLVMLTQGTTKVYKRRPGLRPLSHLHTSPPSSDPNLTRQRMHIRLSSSSFLLLLPESVSPFRASIYSQTQRFVLPADRTASVLILDWVNSGRGQRPQEVDEEIWSMDSYGSTNEIWVGDERIMRERMVLDNSHFALNAGGSLSPIANQLSPYNVYATILILGPHFTTLFSYLAYLSDHSRQFQLKEPPGLAWSFSEIDGKLQAGVVRIAACEVEDARKWLREVMTAGGVAALVGEGMWPRCI